MNEPIIDSSMTADEAKKQNNKLACPKEVIDELILIDVEYFSFDGFVHRGQILIHKNLADDVRGAFQLLLEDKFPIESVIPVADKRFAWDDSKSTAANNTSAFNYRYVRGTNIMSNHSQGRAIDINPALNPYLPGNKVFPPHASYNPVAPGTILAGSKLVKYFEDRGWRWGGNWEEDLDYQHFEKSEK
ncbi:M15 family metallopeptidase [Candidatus Saccharibacteria bacterium]|nr:M15 family metallopeptidase [Candidatus Saccharibacteria bacterium]